MLETVIALQPHQAEAIKFMLNHYVHNVFRMEGDRPESYYQFRVQELGGVLSHLNLRAPGQEGAFVCLKHAYMIQSFLNDYLYTPVTYYNLFNEYTMTGILAPGREELRQIYLYLSNTLKKVEHDMKKSECNKNLTIDMPLEDVKLLYSAMNYSDFAGGATVEEIEQLDKYSNMLKEFIKENAEREQEQYKDKIRKQRCVVFQHLDDILGIKSADDIEAQSRLALRALQELTNIIKDYIEGE